MKRISLPVLLCAALLASGQETSKLNKVDIDYMMRGYFYASSKGSSELNGLGGWGGSSNGARSFTPPAGRSGLRISRGHHRRGRCGWEIPRPARGGSQQWSGHALLPGAGQPLVHEDKPCARIPSPISSTCPVRGVATATTRSSSRPGNNGSSSCHGMRVRAPPNWRIKLTYNTTSDERKKARVAYSHTFPLE